VLSASNSFAAPARALSSETIASFPSLPFSEDSEKGLLGSLLLAHREVREKCHIQITPEAFYVPAHRFVYEVLLEAGAKIGSDGKVDFIWLKGAVKKERLLEDVGGVEFLNSLYSFVPTAANADFYINELRLSWGKRTAILDYQQRIEAALDPASETHEWDPDGAYSDATIERSLRGASLLEYSAREIDQSQTLLGNRYLCRGGGMFIVAPSGHGKSVLTIQMAIELACGRKSFGINPSRPLRSLIIQAEDDEGDIIEMSQVVTHLGLSKDERQLINRNTHIEFVNDATGHEFLQILDDLLAQCPADLVWINPYTAYLGADIKDDRANTRFLRNGLNPILTKRHCAVVLVHHTPKTTFRDSSNWKPSEWMYSGAGAAVLTNWARAYLAVDLCDSTGIYKFIAAKRGKRIGWKDECGSPVYETFWSHSRVAGQLLWLPASPQEIVAAKSCRTKSVDANQLLQMVPIDDPVPKTTFKERAAMELGVGINKVDNAMKQLQVEGKLFTRRIKNPGKGRSFAGWAKTSEPSEEVV
jgi:hypothetical protein